MNQIGYASTILIVDDNNTNLLLLDSTLRKAGYHVETASNGMEALEKARHCTPDLIVLDILMPDMDGYAVCREYKTDTRLKNVPVLFLSGMTETRDMVRGFECGGDDFISKPFKREEVLTRIKAHLEASRYRNLLEDRNTVLAAKHRNAFEQAAVGMAYVHPDSCRIIDVNQRLCDMLGYTREELLATCLTALHHPDDDRLLYEKLVGPVSTKRRFLRKDGRVMWSRLTASLVICEMEAQTDCLVVIDDITERHHAEEELRKLSEAVEQSPMYIVITDVNGQIEYVNPAFSRVTGYSAQEVLGKNPRILKSGDTPLSVYQDLWQTLMSGRTWRGTFKNRKKDGSVFWERTVISPSRNPDSVITHLVAVKEDITQSKETEEALRISEERLRLALDGTNTGLYEWYPATNTTYYSPTWFTMLSYQPDEFPHNYDTWAELLHPEDRRQAEKTLIEFINSNAPGFTNQFRMRTHDGAYRHIFSQGVAVEWDETGKITRLIGTHTDITNLQRAREEANRRREQLIQAERLASLGTLVSGVAHEINNPNAYILINGSIVQDMWQEMLTVVEQCRDEGCLPEDCTQALESFQEDGAPAIAAILDGSQRITRIVNELKNFSRQDSGSMEQQVDINAVVESSINIVQHKIKTSTDHFVKKLAPDLPPIRGNAQRIEQVVLNLLTNACEALRDRRDSIRVTTAPHNNGTMVAIAVADNGIGMTEETRCQVMDPFFTTKRDQGGTGLGLAVSVRIVEDHQGALNIDTQPDQGTTITVLLPVAPFANGEKTNG